MKKIIILLAILISTSAKTFALQIVYPKTNPAKINSNSTFFIGATEPNEKLKINDVEVPVSPKGAFAQIVPLNVGVNEFKILSGNEVINFSIEREKPSTVTQKPCLIEYSSSILFSTVKDNVALRETAFDGGINRISELPKGVFLKVTGEKGNFYRVCLGSKKEGWILKKDVEQAQSDDKANFLELIRCKKDKHFYIYEFELSKRVPFSLKEDNGLHLSIFNLENQCDETYLLDIVGEKLAGYEIFYDNNTLVLKVRKPLKIDCDKPLKHVSIALDAGHGGVEKGAIACGGEFEKDINLAIAKNLKSELEAQGARVFMTREDDVQISLSDRVKFAKDKNSDLLISIHANALPDGQDPLLNRGTSVYYYHNQAKSLAENILTQMTTQLGTQNDKVRQGSLALVRPTASVSVLIEVGYVINPSDYELLINPSFQKQCAKAIADGIKEYLKN